MNTIDQPIDSNAIPTANMSEHQIGTVPRPIEMSSVAYDFLTIFGFMTLTVALKQRLVDEGRKDTDGMTSAIFITMHLAYTARLMPQIFSEGTKMINKDTHPDLPRLHGEIYCNLMNSVETNANDKGLTDTVSKSILLHNGLLCWNNDPIQDFSKALPSTVGA